METIVEDALTSIEKAEAMLNDLYDMLQINFDKPSQACVNNFTNHHREIAVRFEIARDYCEQVRTTLERSSMC